MTDGGAINAQYDRWEIKAPRCHDQCHDKKSVAIKPGAVEASKQAHF
jgi:hypothetical protein